MAGCFGLLGVPGPIYRKLQEAAPGPAPRSGRAVHSISYGPPVPSVGAPFRGPLKKGICRAM